MGLSEQTELTVLVEYRDPHAPAVSRSGRRYVPLALVATGDERAVREYLDGVNQRSAEWWTEHWRKHPKDPSDLGP